MIDLRLGDCLAILPTIPDASVDAIICDPPYPEISREYGRMTEADWHVMMRGIVVEARRVLKPSGSAVFILQPNSRKVGSMRPWLFEFQAWTCREWNMVQDAWWWNNTVLPNGGAITDGLLRGSVKACVWLGESDCFRDQAGVLGPISKRHAARIRQYQDTASSGIVELPSGNSVDYAKACRAAASRGGTTPFNLITAHHGAGQTSSGSHGHPAGTPQDVCDWWARYICPPGGTILDPFMGSGTTGLSAIKYGCDYIGIEKMAKYHEVARSRIAAELAKTALLTA